MTTLDMVVLADMWINLSGTAKDSPVQTLILPGVMTGRDEDRMFTCRIRQSAPARPENVDWGSYLETAVDYVDFVEKK